MHLACRYIFGLQYRLELISGLRGENALSLVTNSLQIGEALIELCEWPKHLRFESVGVPSQMLVPELGQLLTDLLLS